ncbi:unnamed protein product, partial [Linum tenue]
MKEWHWQWGGSELGMATKTRIYGYPSDLTRSTRVKFMLR